jgi:ribosomal protein S18 acetylase RimI-like enzyme
MVPLDEEHEEQYSKMVYSDPVEYLFFIIDWKYLSELAKIYLAMDGDSIEGLMVIYKDSVIQLRGKKEAMAFLFEQIDKDEIEMMAPLAMQEMALRSYEPAKIGEVYAMVMVKDDLKVQITKEPEELTVDDVKAIQELLTISNPASWATWTEEGLAKTFEDYKWYGIKVDGELAAIGQSRIYDFTGVVHVISTHPDHRGKGYAKSIVSSIVSSIFEVTDTAIIHVFVDNTPAVRAYSSVGFKPHSKNFLMGKAKRKKA